MSRQLFQLVFNRLSRDQQIAPKFIGQFLGIDSLPRQMYPPVYYWVDLALGGAIRLSFNTPLLMDICADEAKLAGIPTDEPTCREALSIFQDITTQSFQTTMNKLTK